VVYLGQHASADGTEVAFSMLRGLRLDRCCEINRSALSRSRSISANPASAACMARLSTSRASSGSSTGGPCRAAWS